MSTSAGMTELTSKGRNERRRRRDWTEEEKRGIVWETQQAGASVAEVARRHGVNANLLFTWRRAARMSATAGASVCLSGSVSPDAAAAPPQACGFIPIGVFARTDEDGPAPASASTAAVTEEAAPRRQAASRPEAEERSGLIEIDLEGGTRLRVDAFVDERALRRVLTVLRSAS